MERETQKNNAKFQRVATIMAGLVSNPTRDNWRISDFVYRAQELNKWIELDVPLENMHLATTSPLSELTKENL